MIYGIFGGIKSSADQMTCAKDVIAEAHFLSCSVFVFVSVCISRSFTLRSNRFSTLLLLSVCLVCLSVYRSLSLPYLLFLSFFSVCISSVSASIFVSALVLPIFAYSPFFCISLSVCVSLTLSICLSRCLSVSLDVPFWRLGPAYSDLDG